MADVNGGGCREGLCTGRSRVLGAAFLARGLGLTAKGAQRKGTQPRLAGAKTDVCERKGR